MKPFLDGFKSSFKQMYPAVNANPDYTRVINQRNYQRLQDWLLDAAQKGAHIEKLCEENIDDGTIGGLLLMCIALQQQRLAAANFRYKNSAFVVES